MLRYLQIKRKEWCIMKKLVILLTALLMIAAIFSGCKKDDASASEAETSQSAAAADTQSPAALPETAAATDAVSTEPVDPSWFSDAVFIGDSITVALDYACADDPSLLGSAQFVCSQSLGYHNALWDLNTEGAVHPTYKGETVLAETAAQITGAKKVFILLGVNDIGTYGAEDTCEQAAVLAEHILSYSPDVKIYFQSTTPMLDDKESGWLNNDKICDFNERLQAYCKEKGFGFLDVYHQMCDEYGDLKEEYCGDPDVQGIHFNTEGCRIWADYLKASAGSIDVSAQVSEASHAANTPAPSAGAASSADAQQDSEDDVIYYAPEDDDDYYAYDDAYDIG